MRRVVINQKGDGGKSTIACNLGAGADHNDKLVVEGIVVNQFRPRATLPREVVQALRAQGLPVLRTMLSSEDPPEGGSHGVRRQPDQNL